MCLRMLFMICYVFVSVDSGHEKPRRGRLFSFNVLDDDIKVDLDFSIPFISIPVKKTLETTYESFGLPTININPATLVLGGAVVLGSTIALPLLAKSYTQYNFQKRYSRILDNAEFGADAVITFTSEMVSNKHSLRGCTLRIACWTAQRDFVDTFNVLRRIASNKLLSSMINSTAVEDAMLSGKNGRDCYTYGPCPLANQHIGVLLNNLEVFIPSIQNSL